MASSAPVVHELSFTKDFGVKRYLNKVESSHYIVCKLFQTLYSCNPCHQCSEAPMSSQAPITMPKMLASIGHRLKGASDAISVEDALSSLDCVRFAAFSNNDSVLSCKPCPLISDSLMPTSFFFHNTVDKKENDTTCKGGVNLHRYTSMMVVGACMMETNTASFPVCILFSRSQKLLMIYAHDMCLATLEADLYDSAFGDCKWEDFVLKEEAVWIKNSRQEAAVAGRNVGFDKLPDFMAGDDDMYSVRYGVVPFMCLRTVKNSCEMSMVTKALAKTLAVIPMGNDLAIEAKGCQCIQLATVFETGDPIVPREVSQVSSTNLCSWSDQISKRSVLTAVSTLILQQAYDDSTDGNGELISEIGFQMSPHQGNSAVIGEAAASESAVVRASLSTKSTELQACTDKPPTLPHAMENVRSNYAVRLLADCDELGVKKAIETVSSVLFCREDFSRVASVCCSETSPTLTIASALSVLGKCLMEKQALVIASRETDGRLGSIKAVGSTRTIEKVSIKSFRRYVISPWATVLIVDKSRIFHLEIREPDTVTSTEMRKEKLRLKEDAKLTQRPTLDTRELEQKIETLSASLQTTTESLTSIRSMLSSSRAAHDVLKKEKDDMEAFMKELSRKVDYLVTAKAESFPTPPVEPLAPAPAPPPAPAPVNPQAPAPSPLSESPSAPTFADETSATLKRTLEALEAYDKRFRSV